MTEIKQKESDPKKKDFRIILVVLLVQASLLVCLSWSTSPNRTEVGHLGAAVYFWNYGKFDVFHVNPPLVRIAAGSPIALFCKPKYDWTGYSSRPQDRCEWKLGNAFIAANELNNLRIYVFLARLACIPFVLLGGYFGFLFASELYGEWSGVVFIILWTFSPLILGWGATICPDVAAASMGILGLYAFWHWLKSPLWWKAIIAGMCLGLMPLTKMTWIIAFPIWFLLFVIWKFWRQENNQRLSWKQFVAIPILATCTINSGYAYDGTFRLLKDYQFLSGMLTGKAIEKDSPINPGNRFKDSWIGYIPAPFPQEFIQGIDTQRLDFEKGMDSYSRGVWSNHGWWWYYGYVLLLKEPLGVWVLTVFALVASYIFKDFNTSKRDELIVLLPMILIFAFLSSQDGFSIHPRYVIILLPLLYIFIAKLGQAFTLKKTRHAFVTTFCLVWISGSSLWVYPHSMSYFNELAGEPQNWPQLLLGSNIDWGQDIYELKEWVEKHPAAKPIYISVEMPIPLSKLGIDGKEMPSDQVQGWFVVSVNSLYSKNGRCKHLLQHKPVTRIGYSIYVYHLSDICRQDR